MPRKCCTSVYSNGPNLAETIKILRFGRNPKIWLESFPARLFLQIDRLFPFVLTEMEDAEPRPMLSQGSSAQVAVLIRLVEQIPDELLVLDPQQNIELIASIAALHQQLENWRIKDETFRYVSGLPKLSPVTIIRRALAKCPDEHPIAESADLEFIEDSDLRLGLRNDVSTVTQALSNSEWKSVTVIAGSVMEALLLWRLNRQPPPDRARAIKDLREAGTFKFDPPTDLESWNLFQYIEVAATLKLITLDTAQQSRLAKDFRNLIHPGRGIRLGQSCNKATALTAVAAMEHLINDLDAK